VVVCAQINFSKLDDQSLIGKAWERCCSLLKHFVLVDLETGLHRVSKVILTRSDDSHDVVLVRHIVCDQRSRTNLVQLGLQAAHNCEGQEKE